MGIRLTLADWVVVALVVGLAILFGIPFLNAVREVSHPPLCQNHLRQIGLALNSYEARLGVYPPTSDAENGHSCFLHLMNDFDYPDLFNAYNLSLANWSTVENGSGQSNASISRQEFKLLKCPIAPALPPTPAAEVQSLDGRRDFGSALFAKTNYAVNWGGGRQGWGSDFEQTCGIFRGPMNPDGTLSIRDVIDGAGFTILTGEKKDSQGWNVGGWAGSEFDVRATPGYEGDAPWASKVYTGSFHPHGLNFGFVDGSVRYISNRLDRRLWYALITRNGGEVIDRDQVLQ